ncbi:MAG: hypothetical protein KDC26_03665 [Armatimonadetes bacterium]|nr:hypothetical protein [Armatimonadota bacterium]
MNRPTLQPVILNGAHGEGGGALLRTALIMSALMEQPVRIHSIRGAMRKPGLNAEDLGLLLALRNACLAEVEGDEIGSHDLTFIPKRQGRSFDLEVDLSKMDGGKVPGATCVIAEALVPLMARAGALSRLTIFGETHSNNTLSFDTFENSTCVGHAAQGIGIFPALVTTGFGFGSRGKTVIEYEPSEVIPFDWIERGEMKECGITITATDAPQPIVAEVERIATAQMTNLGWEPEVHVQEVRGREPGLSLTFWAKCATGMGSASGCMNRGGKPQAYVDAIWGEFLDWWSSDTAVDPFLADQLLVPAVLADGKTHFSTQRITRRLVTMAWIIKQFIPIQVTIKGREGTKGSVTIQR